MRNKQPQYWDSGYLGYIAKKKRKKYYVEPVEIDHKSLEDVMIINRDWQTLMLIDATPLPNDKKIHFTSFFGVGNDKAGS